MNPTAASAFCMDRKADLEALRKFGTYRPKVWDFGYCRVIFDEKYLVRVVSRQGMTLAEAKHVSYHQVHALVLQLFW